MLRTFLNKERIAAEREVLLPVRLESERAPDAADRGLVQSRDLRHRARRPVCAPVRLALQRAHNHSFDVGIAELARLAGMGTHREARLVPRPHNDATTCSRSGCRYPAPTRSAVVAMAAAIRPVLVLDRQLVEQSDCTLLFCWFVGPGMDAPTAPSRTPAATATPAHTPAQWRAVPRSSTARRTPRSTTAKPHRRADQSRATDDPQELAAPMSRN